MQLTAVLFLSLSTFAIASIGIECDYKLVKLTLSECETSGLEVSNDNETVSSISGTLGAIVSYKKIKTFKVTSSPLLEYFPKGVDSFFPNLETLIITGTGLKQLTADDIKFFPNLTTLDLSGNRLEEIDAEAFKFNEKLETINLSGNKLTKAVFDFEFLKNLKTINLYGNKCINEAAENPAGLKKIQDVLEENCSKGSSRGFFFTFLLVLLAAAVFLIMLFGCMKWITK